VGTPTGETVFSKPSKIREKSMKKLPEPELCKTLQNPRKNAVVQAFFRRLSRGVFGGIFSNFSRTFH